jgi:hypothetical protein
MMLGGFKERTVLDPKSFMLRQICFRDTIVTTATYTICDYTHIPEVAGHTPEKAFLVVYERNQPTYMLWKFGRQIYVA